MHPMASLAIDDSKWRCCCGRWHIKTATRAIAYIQASITAFLCVLLLAICAMPTPWRDYFMHEQWLVNSYDTPYNDLHYKILGVSLTIALILMLCVCTVLCIGVSRERRLLFIPYLTVTVILIIALIFRIATALMVRSLPMLLLAIVAILLQCYFLWTTFRCFVYLSQKHAQLPNRPIISQVVRTRSVLQHSSNNNRSQQQQNRRRTNSETQIGNNTHDSGYNNTISSRGSFLLDLDGSVPPSYSSIMSLTTAEGIVGIVDTDRTTMMTVSPGRPPPAYDSPVRDDDEVDNKVILL